MRTISLALALTLAASSAFAAPCRNSHGKFIKCPVAAPTHCRDAKGHFASCSVPGAKPMAMAPKPAPVAPLPAPASH